MSGTPAFAASTTPVDLGTTDSRIGTDDRLGVRNDQSGVLLDGFSTMWRFWGRAERDEQPELGAQGAQARDGEGGHEDAVGGMFERGQGVLAQARRRVDHHVPEHGREPCR